MECWSDGVMGKKIKPTLQYSITPILQSFPSTFNLQPSACISLKPQNSVNLNSMILVVNFSNISRVFTVHIEAESIIP